jgi:tetratricopeptide (TPR) repeat protein
MPTPDELVASAQEHLGQGRLDLAAQAYAEALEQDHKQLAASLGLARISMSLSMVEQALAILDRTLGFAPQNVEALVLRGLVEEGRGNLTGALDYFSRASKLSQASFKPVPPSAASLERGDKPGRKRRAQAPSAPEAGSVSAADAYAARYNLGRALAVARRYKEAIPELMAAAKLQPGATDPHYALGVVHKESGRMGDAILAFTRTLEIDPTFLDGYMTLADVLSEAGKQDAAEKVLLQAQSLFPDSGPVYDKLAAVCFKQGDLAKVVQTLQQQVRVQPANESAYINLATFALAGNDVPAAAAAVDALLKLDPASWRGLHLRSMLYDMADRVELAMADLREAARLAPQEWKPKNDLGTLLNAQAQKDKKAAVEAVAVLESACAVAPADELAPRYNLALAYWNAGRQADARRQADALVRSGPEGDRVVEQAREVLAAMDTAEKR